MNEWVHKDKGWAVELLLLLGTQRWRCRGRKGMCPVSPLQRLAHFQKEQDWASLWVKICWTAFSLMGLLDHLCAVTQCLSWCHYQSPRKHHCAVEHRSLKFQIFWLLKEVVTSSSMTTGKKKRGELEGNFPLYIATLLFLVWPLTLCVTSVAKVLSYFWYANITFDCLPLHFFN